MQSARSMPKITRVAARRRGAIVLLQAAEILAFEARGGLAFVHSIHGRFDIDVTLAEIQTSAVGHDYARIHRSWLVNMSAVRAFEQESGASWLFLGTAIDDGKGIRVTISRDNVQRVRAMLVRGGSVLKFV